MWQQTMTAFLIGAVCYFGRLGPVDIPPLSREKGHHRPPVHVGLPVKFPAAGSVVGDVDISPEWFS